MFAVLSYEDKKLVLHKYFNGHKKHNVKNGQKNNQEPPKSYKRWYISCLLLFLTRGNLFVSMFQLKISLAVIYLVSYMVTPICSVIVNSILYQAVNETNW